MRELNGIGEIVSGDSPKSVDIDVLRMEMSDAGLDPGLACNVHPANAFHRAIDEMSQHIDRVNRVRLKIEEYRNILAHHVDGLEKSLTEVNSKFLKSFGLSVPDPVPQEEEKPDPAPAPRATTISKEEIRRQFAEAGL